MLNLPLVVVVAGAAKVLVGVTSDNNPLGRPGDLGTANRRFVVARTALDLSSRRRSARERILENLVLGGMELAECSLLNKKQIQSVRKLISSNKSCLTTVSMLTECVHCFVATRLFLYQLALNQVVQQAILAKVDVFSKF